MWPFSSSSSKQDPSGAGAKPESSSLDVPRGPDGISEDVPVIAYTEQVIAEKEASLRKYIQDNYAKLNAVEKELEALRLEVKLTSGSKKAALELLRKKIEESAERIKSARVREQAAKQAWEAAAKVVADEEAHKDLLCDHLRLMIQESARQQFEKLESLTLKLDALNPEMKGAALSAIEGLRAQIAPHGLPVLNGAQDPAPPLAPAPSAPGDHVASAGDSNETSARGGVDDGNTASTAAQDAQGGQGAQGQAGEGRDGDARASSDAEGQEKDKPGPQQQPPAHASGAGKQERAGVQLKGGRGRGGLVAAKGQRASGAMGLHGQTQGGWTGAGFDVDNI